MRLFLCLVVALVVLVTAGCVEEYDPATNVTTKPTTVTTTVPAVTPTSTPRLPSEEMAYISGIKCAVGDKTEETYHCDGNVRVRSGSSLHTVQVFARYADNNTFHSGTFELGGNNAVSYPFSVFPDIKYKNQRPDYFVKVDGTMYPVTWSGSTGTAWSNR